VKDLLKRLLHNRIPLRHQGVEQRLAIEPLRRMRGQQADPAEHSQDRGYAECADPLGCFKCQGQDAAAQGHRAPAQEHQRPPVQRAYQQPTEPERHERAGERGISRKRPVFPGNEGVCLPAPGNANTAGQGVGALTRRRAGRIPPDRLRFSAALTPKSGTVSKKGNPKRATSAVGVSRSRVRSGRETQASSRQAQFCGCARQGACPRRCQDHDTQGQNVRSRVPQISNRGSTQILPLERHAQRADASQHNLFIARRTAGSPPRSQRPLVLGGWDAVDPPPWWKGFLRLGGFSGF